MNQTKAKGGKGCFKIGCFSCAGVVVLLVVIPVLLAGLGFVVGAPEEDQQTEGYRHDLPPLGPLPAEAPPTAQSPQGAGGEGSAEAVAAEVGAGERQLMPEAVGAPAPGRIELDLEMGEFFIEPGPHEGGLNVDADYDTGSFELVESYEPAEDGSWTYKLRFKSKVGWFRRLWGDGRVDNEVRLTVPRGRPIALTGSIAMGESEVDLGGLWLTEVDLRLGAGEHELDVSEPAPHPADRVIVEGSFGEIRVLSLGNLSPATARVVGSAGALEVDLEGLWRNDAAVEVTHGFGECRIRLPRDVHVEIERASVTAGERRLRSLDREEPLPEDAPTVKLSASSTAGELRID